LCRYQAPKGWIGYLSNSNVRYEAVFELHVCNIHTRQSDGGDVGRRCSVACESFVFNNNLGVSTVLNEEYFQSVSVAFVQAVIASASDVISTYEQLVITSSSETADCGILTSSKQEQISVSSSNTTIIDHYA